MHLNGIGMTFPQAGASLPQVAWSLISHTLTIPEIPPDSNKAERIPPHLVLERKVFSEEHRRLIAIEEMGGSD
jgi:hypothetical protein